jgi:hypothetical protein
MEGSGETLTETQIACSDQVHRRVSGYATPILRIIWLSGRKHGVSSSGTLSVPFIKMENWGYSIKTS